MYSKEVVIKNQVGLHASQIRVLAECRSHPHIVTHGSACQADG